MIVSPCLPSDPGPWVIAAIGCDYHVIPRDLAEQIGATVLFGSIPSKRQAERDAEFLERRGRAGRG